MVHGNFTLFFFSLSGTSPSGQEADGKAQAQRHHREGKDGLQDEQIEPNGFMDLWILDNPPSCTGQDENPRAQEFGKLGVNYTTQNLPTLSISIFDYSGFRIDHTGTQRCLYIGVQISHPLGIAPSTLKPL